MKNKEEIIKIIKNLKKDDPIIVLTKDKTMLKGRGIEILTLITNFAVQLAKKGCPKSLLHDVIDIGYYLYEEKNKPANKNKNFNEIMDNMIEQLKKLEETLNRKEI